MTNEKRYVLKAPSGKTVWSTFKKVIHKNYPLNNESLERLMWDGPAIDSFSHCSFDKNSRKANFKIKDFEAHEDEKGNWHYAVRVIYHRFELRQGRKLVANVWVPFGRVDAGHRYVRHYRGKFKGWKHATKQSFPIPPVKMTNRKYREWGSRIMKAIAFIECNQAVDSLEMELSHFNSFYANESESVTEIMWPRKPKWLQKDGDRSFRIV